MLVRNLREKGGPGKLRSYWENKIYRVLERRGEGPVYVVQPEKGGEVRVLHRNHLLPVGEKLRELDEEPEKPKPKQKISQNKQSKVIKEQNDESEDESSEMSEEESKQKREVRPQRQRRKPDRLRYDELGSPGDDDRSKDRVLGCIVQLLEHQQVLVSMLSSVFGHFQKLNIPE